MTYAESPDELTEPEERYCDLVRRKDRALRDFLEQHSLSEAADARKWLTYLIGLKSTLGNINNDLGFIATLLVKSYLAGRFGHLEFDAAGKPQSASGIDIEVRTADGLTIIGELKTTKPYQPGFGAAQRTAIIKDLSRLANSHAHHKFMFVVDADAFSALCKPSFSSRAPGVEIVDLLSGKTFSCGAPLQ